MPSKVFYTAKEAQERLGVAANRFNYLVRSGRITRVIPPGRKLGVYPVTEVDKLAAMMDATMSLYNPNEVHFDTAEPEDIEGVVELGLSVFQGVTTPAAIQLQWLERCPEAIHVLKTNHGDIVGHMIMLPMPEERAIAVVSRKLIVGDIPLEEIGNFTSGTVIHCYIRQIATLPSSYKNVKSHWGMVLLAGATAFIEQLGSRGIQLGNIYALATTRDGRHLCQLLGFDRLPIIPDPAMPNEVAYRLNMQESGVIFARNYRDNYARSQAEGLDRVNPYRNLQGDEHTSKAQKPRTKKEAHA